ncbi:3-methyladenine DNA glycosylase [Amylibacter marinus]|uniref:DNA-3-methyladenine glycosylase II n=1 Tax=Amylibacter marinus TaxID=1475483 RepID=A0ABQ5VRI6_9RHOB|nr:DNA-3-methyladenine glycosylase 2 family protein [Amylibacter marinus]GLQ34025.1 3-methyladenine DNA glycosylase [Amylibacter marinus]
MDERCITSQGCIAEGAGYLCANHPEFQEVVPQLDEIPLRLRGDGFEAVLKAIVGQQVSLASAQSIWARLEGAGLSTQGGVARASEAELRACGLSRPKVRYAIGLADSDIDYGALRSLPSTDVIARLIEIKGIGTWSAEIYAMFSLGRADVFAHGDLALQEATRHMYGLNARPSERQMRELALKWSPWRGVAARILWAYYKQIKSREGI